MQVWTPKQDYTCRTSRLECCVCKHVAEDALKGWRGWVHLHNRHDATGAQQPVCLAQNGARGVLWQLVRDEAHGHDVKAAGRQCRSLSITVQQRQPLRGTGGSLCRGRQVCAHVHAYRHIRLFIKTAAHVRWVLDCAAKQAYYTKLASLCAQLCAQCGAKHSAVGSHLALLLVVAPDCYHVG